MFSYYGSKSKIVDYYPPPKYGKIIEPFAGSARYSLKYWDREVTLVDKYEYIVKIWKWLQVVSKYDILKLPILENKEDVRKYKLSQEEMNFMRFQIGQGLGHPQWKCSSQCDKKTQKRKLKDISDNLFKIKHWNIILGDYKDCENEEQTWFIDPPYQFGGHGYIESNKFIDFDYLRDWCIHRKGQVIVCENTKATWMPFLPMIDMKGCQFKTTEAIWSNYETNYEFQQQKLF